MKDKHYHWLIGYFMENGTGCYYMVNDIEKMTTKEILKINKEIEVESNAFNVGIFSIQRLECDCDD